MIRYRDTILENYSIDPITAIITNDKDEIQKTHILNGRPYFKCMVIHKIQVHTHIGYKLRMDIHHLDENKMNNSLSNLVYLTHAEHAKLHQKGKLCGPFSDEHKKKISESQKGKTLSEETKLKLSATMKGKNKDKIWINNNVEEKFIPLDEEIPEGFIRGRLKNEKRKI